MKRVRDLLRWKHGLARRHVILSLVVPYTAVYLFAAYTGIDIPVAIGMTGALLPIVIVYSLAMGSMAELKTIAAWCVVAFFGFSGVAHAVPGPHMMTSESILFTSIAAVAMIVFALVVLVAIANTLWERWLGRNNCHTPEERVLTTEEYAEFEPHPYEYELTRVHRRLQDVHQQL